MPGKSPSRNAPFELFEEGLKLSRELVADEPGRSDFRFDLAFACFCNGYALLNLVQDKEARARLLEAQEILVALVMEEPRRADFRSNLESLERFMATTVTNLW